MGGERRGGLRLWVVIYRSVLSGAPIGKTKTSGDFVQSSPPHSRPRSIHLNDGVTVPVEGRRACGGARLQGGVVVQGGTGLSKTGDSCLHGSTQNNTNTHVH